MERFANNVPKYKVLQRKEIVIPDDVLKHCLQLFTLKMTTFLI